MGHLKNPVFKIVKVVGNSYSILISLCAHLAVFRNHLQISDGINMGRAEIVRLDHLPKELRHHCAFFSSLSMSSKTQGTQTLEYDIPPPIPTRHKKDTD